MSRGGFKITTQGQHAESRERQQEVPSWMKEFAASAEKIVAAEEERQKSAVTVVDKARDRQATVYEYMYSIMNGKKPLYSSVEEAVHAYQEKTGLAAHLEKVKADIDNRAKIAAKFVLATDEDEKKNSEAIIFVKYPNLKGGIQQIAKTYPGISIPAVAQMICENVRNIEAHELEDVGFLDYVNEVLSNNQVRSDSNDIISNLGADYQISLEEPGSYEFNKGR